MPVCISKCDIPKTSMRVHGLIVQPGTLHNISGQKMGSQWI